MSLAHPETTTAARILFIGEEPRWTWLPARHPSRASFDMAFARNLEEGIATLAKEPPDLVLVAAGSRPREIHAKIERIREVSDLPAMVMAHSITADEAVEALWLGADECLPDDLEPTRLVARVASVLRLSRLASPRSDQPALVDDYLSIDFAQDRARAGGHSHRLRPAEARLLYHLFHNRGRWLSRSLLLAKLWGAGHRDECELLDVRVALLRRHIEPDPARSRYIFADDRLGYLFAPLPPE